MVDWSDSKVKPLGFNFLEATANAGPLHFYELEWRASLVDTKPHSKKEWAFQVELKTTVGQEASVLIIVALDGWNYKNERGVPGPRISPWNVTKGLQVRMSANGAMKFTLAQFAELQQVVEEVHSVLIEVEAYVKANPATIGKQ